MSLIILHRKKSSGDTPRTATPPVMAVPPGGITLPAQPSKPSSAIQAAMEATLASIELPPPSGSAVSQDKTDKVDTDEESDEEKTPKKEVVPLVFKSRKEAMEAFKALLREKVLCPIWPCKIESAEVRKLCERTSFRDHY